MQRAIIVATVAALLVTACESEEDDFARRNTPTGGGDGAPVDPTQPGACKEGEPHVGFGNTNFVAERKVGGIGNDRRRVKPYSALKSEFTRALGKVPAGLEGAGPAYGSDPPRWYSEPTAGAVNLSTTYSLAFTSCYDSMTAAKFAAAPTADSAKAECAAMQRKSWQRSPTPEETQACADLAVKELATEPVPRRRWAHACAAVLTSSGFITY
jgi:hypothetical protein